MLRVGLHENIFILFLLAIKTAGSAQKLRVGRVSGNTAIFVYAKNLHLYDKVPARKYIYACFDELLTEQYVIQC